MIDNTKGFFSEFKRFAVKGSVVELGVAVVVGSALIGVINSFSTDVLGPFLALLTNSVDFKTLSYSLRPDLVIRYGNFLQALFNFLVVSLTVFLLFKLFSYLRGKVQ